MWFFPFEGLCFCPCVCVFFFVFFFALLPEKECPVLFFLFFFFFSVGDPFFRSSKGIEKRFPFERDRQTERQRERETTTVPRSYPTMWFVPIPWFVTKKRSVDMERFRFMASSSKRVSGRVSWGGWVSG